MKSKVIDFMDALFYEEIRRQSFFSRLDNLVEKERSMLYTKKTVEEI